MTGLKISDQRLAEFFGTLAAVPKEENLASFSYAITPYECREEYERDRRLLAEHNSAAAPQTRFLLIHAAKVERTDPAVLWGAP